MRDLTRFNYVRQLDVDALNAPERTGRWIQHLLHLDSDAEACTVSFIATPKGPGSPFGIHVHDFEQVCYILSGVMSVTVAGEHIDVPAGGLVVFPAGVEHTYDNEHDEELRHISINAPAEEPDKPHARPVR